MASKKLKSTVSPSLKTKAKTDLKMEPVSFKEMPAFASATAKAMALIEKPAAEMEHKPRADSRLVHYRRCHLCNEVTESDDGRVLACNHCGKVMAPYFFFEEKDAVAFTTSELRPHVPPGQHPPVRGLTAFW